MKRGEIYFIKSHEVTGSETAKARPGVIVSNNVLNATSTVVEVVYLTTKPKKDMPTHATINATGIPSIALCEHIDHVDKSRLDNWLGMCSEEEMQAIDQALLCSLGIEAPNQDNKEALEEALHEAVKALEELAAERDRYAKMVDHLLEANA